MTVADTILEQLGGRKFLSMTGAKMFTSTDTTLTFRIPRAKNGITAVRITLKLDDTYKMEFLKLTPKGPKPFSVVAEHATGVFCDKLQEIFTHETGLYTHL